MLLCYIDEAGTSYAKGRDGYFIDGPYVLWVSILVSEKHFFDIERVFQALARKKISSQDYIELHATKIWAMRSTQSEQVTGYFEELLQFTSKLHIPVVVGLRQKNPGIKADKKQQWKDLLNAKTSLISLLEDRLLELDETGVLVSDNEEVSEGKKLKELVFNRTLWRAANSSGSNLDFKPKYQFEYNSSRILDQLHYVDSKQSILLQFTDNLTFVIKKNLEYLYLQKFCSNGDNKKVVREKDFVPVSQETFDRFILSCNVRYASYDDDVRHDVQYGFFSGNPIKPFTDHPGSPINAITPYKELPSAKNS